MINKVRFRIAVIVLGAQGLCEMAVADSAPTISPSSPVYVLMGGTDTLQASGGSCPLPGSEAQCPPWTYDSQRPFTYQWSDSASTTGATYTIPTSSNTGSSPLSITVLGLDQGWKDTAGADGGTTSTPSSAAVEVYVVEVKTEPASIPSVHDGAPIEFEIKVVPDTAKDKVTDVSVTIAPTETGTYYNVQNTISTVAQVGSDMFKWKTPAARWYTTTDGDCGSMYVMYQYEIKFKLNGVEKTIPKSVLVDASTGDIYSGAALRGAAWPNLPYAGMPAITTTHSGGVYTVVASDGTGSSLVRVLSADHSSYTHANSFFKDMVEAEEAEHERQLTDNSTYSGAFCTKQSLINAMNQQGYSASTAQAALNMAALDYGVLRVAHFNDQVQVHFGKVNGAFVANRISMEKAAKAVANASYRCAYKCSSYPQP